MELAKSAKRSLEGEQQEAKVSIPRFFVKCGCLLLEPAYDEELGERFRVVSSSLCRKSEEDEEDKSTNDAGPLGKRQADHHQVVASPDDGRYLPDATEMVMSVFPTDPRLDGGRSRVDDHREDRERCCAHDFGAGQGYQTEISTGGEG